MVQKLGLCLHHTRPTEMGRMVMMVQGMSHGPTLTHPCVPVNESRQTNPGTGAKNTVAWRFPGIRQVLAAQRLWSDTPGAVPQPLPHSRTRPTEARVISLALTRLLPVQDRAMGSHHLALLCRGIVIRGPQWSWNTTESAWVAMMMSTHEIGCMPVQRSP